MVELNTTRWSSFLIYSSFSVHACRDSHIQIHWLIIWSTTSHWCKLLEEIVTASRVINRLIMVNEIVLARRLWHLHRSLLVTFLLGGLLCISFLFFAALEFFGQLWRALDQVLLLLLFWVAGVKRGNCHRNCNLAATTAAFFEVLRGVGDLRQRVIVYFFTSEFLGHVLCRFDRMLGASCRLLFVSLYFDQSEPLFVIALDVTVQMMVMMLVTLERIERLLRVGVEFLMMVLVWEDLL